MSNPLFRSQLKSKKSRARLGEIHTSHGTIKTPAFVPVGTKGTIKTLLPSLIPEIGIQVAFVNTYHLVIHPGVDVISKSGGIHNFSQLNIPLMSDSGGFQVFSLAGKNKSQTQNPKSKTNSKSQNINKENDSRGANIRGEEQPLVVKISEDGVKFRSTYDGQLIEFTPKKSMEFQRKIGADLNMAFDECTYYPTTHEYAEKAMDRTHEWLKRCIEWRLANSDQRLETTNTNSQSQVASCQYLYGIIQGGTYEDLRKKSAEFVVSQDVDGVAIGGISVGETKKEMRDQIKWVADYLPKDKPVHLLGVGQIDDIVDLVKYRIDTFDCVEPTRLARMGTIYKIANIKFQMSNQFSKNKGDLSKRDNVDITRTEFKNNLEPVDIDCNCYVCTHFTKAYLHHLFKQREILGYNLATYHNLWVMERLMERIRDEIGNDNI